MCDYFALSSGAIWIWKRKNCVVDATAVVVAVIEYVLSSLLNAQVQLNVSRHCVLICARLCALHSSRFFLLLFFSRFVCVCVCVFSFFFSSFVPFVLPTRCHIHTNTIDSLSLHLSFSFCFGIETVCDYASQRTVVVRQKKCDAEDVWKGGETTRADTRTPKPHIE